MAQIEKHAEAIDTLKKQITDLGFGHYDHSPCEGVALERFMEAKSTIFSESTADDAKTKIWAASSLSAALEAVDEIKKLGA